MVELLEGNETRAYVKYAAAPTQSGKTASALVGFLASAKKNKTTSFTYCPFANTNRSIFKLGKRSRLSQDVDVAEPPLLSIASGTPSSIRSPVR